MTFKNNRAPLLCYFKLCAAFFSHWWIQTGVTVRERLIWVKIDEFLSHVTLKFEVWPWTQSGSNLTIFRAVWPWNSTDNLERQQGTSFQCYFNLAMIFRAVWPSNFLKLNRAPLQFYFKLCASFQSHWLIQTGVTVQKRPIWVKFDEFFFSRVTLKFDGWPWKTIGHLGHAFLRSVLRLAYSPETPNLGQNRWCFVPCDLEISWMTLENIIS